MKRLSLRAAGRVAATMSVLLISIAAPASGQSKQAGDGYLFHRPHGTVGFRFGYSLADASGDLYDFQRQQFTTGPRSFDALNLAGDLSFNAGSHVALGFTLDGTTRSHRSEYRSWEDNNNQPIEQTTSLSTISMLANVRYDLLSRGRSISRFAWIPATYVPYVGAGVGAVNYHFEQTGDFVDFNTTDVYSDRLTSSGWGMTGQAFAGINLSLTATTSLLTEARYTQAWAGMHQDYSDFGRINLSGLAINVGTSFRF